MRRLVTLALTCFLASPFAPAGFDDCNGNGVDDALDIAVGTSQDCNGNGIPDECDTQVAFATHQIAELLNPWALAVADLDADGDADALVATAGFGIFWFENLASTGGSFFPFAKVVDQGSFPGTPKKIAGADFNGDGLTDVVAAGWVDDELSWWENLGAGAFGPEQVIVPDPAGTVETFAVDDLDGDDDLDVIAAITPTAVFWYENLDGAGSFGPATMVASDSRPVRDVASADLDGDGDRDVIAVFSDSTVNGKVVWLANDGSGAFGPPTTVFATLNQFDTPLLALPADFDGDSDVDVVVQTLDQFPANATTIAWYENLAGAGNFPPAPEDVVNNGADLFPVRQIVDLDRDGDADLLAATGSGSTTEAVWYGNRNGLGVFSGPILVSGQNTSLDAVAVDLDGDADIDVLSSGSGMVVWHENLSDDCNANGQPDSCEPDGNGNGAPDVCELDCDGNGVDDGFEIACATCDADGDGCGDELDCDALDGLVRFAPSPVDDLGWDPGLPTSLAWSVPQHPGADLVRYDTLRASGATDFGISVACIESDDVDTASVDTDIPTIGGLYFYLIRVENDCPDGGALGPDSDGEPRAALGCP